MDAVGAYELDRSDVAIIPVSQEPLAQIVQIPQTPLRQSTPDRSRSREPLRETADVEPRVPQQSEMNFPTSMLPQLASMGLGNVSSDHPLMQNLSRQASSSPTGTSDQVNIRDFFESFMQARVSEERASDVQQFAQGLKDVPPLAGSSMSSEIVKMLTHQETMVSYRCTTNNGSSRVHWTCVTTSRNQTYVS